MKRKKKNTPTIGVDIDKSSNIYIHESRFVGLDKGVQARSSNNINLIGSTFATDYFDDQLQDLESRLDIVLKIIEVEKNHDEKQKKKNCIQYIFNKAEEIRNEQDISNKRRMHDLLINFIGGTGAQVIGTMALKAAGII